MKPAAIDLEIIPGTTYRDTVRLMQPAFVYLPITAIAGTPSGVRLAVEHGLAGDWPVWVRGVVGRLTNAMERYQPVRWRMGEAPQRYLSTMLANIVGIELPLTVDLKVVDTAPGIKGATASNQIKPATTETGLVVNVPPFVNTGDMIRVSTETGEYLARA